jgi:hypothetical protein
MYGGNGPIRDVVHGPGVAPMVPPAVAPERRRLAGSAARARDPRLRACPEETREHPARLGKMKLQRQDRASALGGASESSANNTCYVYFGRELLPRPCESSPGTMPTSPRRLPCSVRRTGPRMCMTRRRERVHLCCLGRRSTARETGRSIAMCCMPCSRRAEVPRCFRPWHHAWMATSTRT